MLFAIAAYLIIKHGGYGTDFCVYICIIPLNITELLKIIRLIKFIIAALHRLRPIDTHLAQYTMLYNNSAKNRYAEPVQNKTKQI